MARELRAAGVDILTLGQYLRPTVNHLAVERFVTPEEFEAYRAAALERGFLECVAGPLVRSSYRAEQWRSAQQRRTWQRRYRAAVTPLLHRLGRVDYEPTWRAMQRHVETRNAETPDEFWFLEHPPVFTMGMNARPEHLLAPGDIPVVHIDRGGQVTYHGPGQLVVYPLLDLTRAKLGVRALVEGIERAIIATVADWGIHRLKEKS